MLIKYISGRLVTLMLGVAPLKLCGPMPAGFANRFVIPSC
nr:MAG TPA: hypothetical protein [Caudoviricetes sp.]